MIHIFHHKHRKNKVELELSSTLHKLEDPCLLKSLLAESMLVLILTNIWAFNKKMELGEKR